MTRLHLNTVFYDEENRICELRLKGRVCEVDLNFDALIDFMRSLHGLATRYPIHEDIDLWASAFSEDQENSLALGMLTVYSINETEKNAEWYKPIGGYDVRTASRLMSAQDRRIFVFATHQEIASSLSMLEAISAEPNQRAEIFDSKLSVRVTDYTSGMSRSNDNQLLADQDR
jgi:hypothetical protein